MVQPRTDVNCGYFYSSLYFAVAVFHAHIAGKGSLRSALEAVEGLSAEFAPKVVQGDVRGRLGRGVAHRGVRDGRDGS